MRRPPALPVSLLCLCGLGLTGCGSDTKAETPSTVVVTTFVEASPTAEVSAPASIGGSTAPTSSWTPGSSNAPPVNSSAFQTSNPYPRPSAPRATITSPKPGRPGQPRGGLPLLATVNRSNAVSLGRAVAQAAFTYDAKLDSTPLDSYRRVLRYLGPEMQKSVTRATSVVVNDVFNNVKDHDSYSKVTVTLADYDGMGRETPTRASHVYHVSAVVANSPAERFERSVLVVTQKPATSKTWLVTKMRYL